MTLSNLEKENRKKARQLARQQQKEYAILVNRIINQDTCGKGDSLHEVIGDGCIFNQKDYYQE